MPATKKDIRNKKNRALDALGLRPQFTQSGVPVKPPKKQFICHVCKTACIDISQMKAHASSKHEKHSFEQCFYVDA